MIAYKFLREGRVGPFSGVAWPAEGEWLQATGGDGACSPRVHACRVEDLPEWMDHELWRVELDGDVRVDCGKLVADRGRLVERVAAGTPSSWPPSPRRARCAPATRALTLLPGGPARDALAGCETAGQLAAAGAALAADDALDPDAARAAGYVGDAARHVLGARAAPATAPTHAAVNGFIAAAAAAFAQDDLGAVARERAWQADWIAARAVLQAG